MVTMARDQASVLPRSASQAARGAGWRSPATLAADVEAGAGVEFALLAPMFLALMLAITNTLMVYLAQEGLETAAENAARLMLTGQAQTFQSYNGSTVTTGMTAAQFKNAVCGTLTYYASANATSPTAFGNPTTLPPFMDCSNLYINVAPASSFSTAQTTPPTLSLDSNGNITGTTFSTSTTGTSQNAVLVVQLLYLWPTVTGPLGLNLGTTAAGNRILTATEVIDTEAFPCPSGVSSC